MKVFTSWSGERSRHLGQALRDWLPLVLHYVSPWLSDADVAAGDRWANEVGKELETSNFGLICVTPENLEASWMLFEAGALAKSMQGTKVVPLLFGLEVGDISGPLAQFQAKKFERTGVAEAIHSINQSAEQSIQEDRERKLFQMAWPTLEDKIKNIPSEAPTETHARPEREILEDLVVGVRALDGRFRTLAADVSEPGPRSIRRRTRPIHPRMIEEMAHMVSEEGDDPVSLLMFGGLLRDDFPWIYEIMLEVYRELRDGDSKSATRAMERLRRVVRALDRGPFWEELAASSKESHMVMMELPRMIDHLLHRFETRHLRRSDESEDDAVSPSER